MNGSYREVPVFTKSSLSANHSLDDNFLAYIFHREYDVNATRASDIRSFLARYNYNESRRWIVLSNYEANYSRYSPYGDQSYADHIALDGIYDLKMKNVSGARVEFDFLVTSTLDSKIGLFRDNATPVNGFEYYKVALGLILASELGNSTYVDQFSKTLSSSTKSGRQLAHRPGTTRWYLPEY